MKIRPTRNWRKTENRDPQNIGSGNRRMAPDRSPEEHRRLVAQLLPPETPPALPKREAKDQRYAQRRQFGHPLTRQQFQAVLAELGFRSYAEYLNSPLWFGIRKRVLKDRRGRCEFCGRRATQIHHEVYTQKNVRGESLEGLYASCRGCHENRHWGSRFIGD